MNLKKAMDWMSASYKAKLIKEAHETGEPLAKIVAKHSMPDFVVLDDDLTFMYDDKRITFDEWKKVNPLGEYGHIVINGGHEEIERFNQLYPSEKSDAAI